MIKDTDIIADTFKNIKDNPENANLDDNDILIKGLQELIGNGDLAKFIANNGDIVVDTIANMTKNSDNFNTPDGIIETQYCLFGRLQASSEQLVLSLKVPQTIVDKHILVQIMNDLRQAVDYLEKQGTS